MGLTLYCGEAEFPFLFDIKPTDDMILWNEGNVFMPEGWEFGRMLIDSDKLSMDGYEKDSYWFRSKSSVLGRLQMLLEKMEKDIDLLSYRYQYSFPSRQSSNRPVSSGCSGFRLGEYSGSIESYPRQFLTLKLMEENASGTGRIVQFIDMRNRESIETDNWGLLRVHKKKHEFTLQQACLELNSFLEASDVEQVKIVPSWQRK